MERGTHSQTEKRPGKETRKDKHVRARSRVISRRNNTLQEKRKAKEGYRTEQVRPDIDGFVVQCANACKGCPVTVAGGAVPAADEGIVASPGGQLIPEEVECSFDAGFDLLGGAGDGFRSGGRPPALSGRAGGDGSAHFFLPMDGGFAFFCPSMLGSFSCILPQVK